MWDGRRVERRNEAHDEEQSPYLQSKNDVHTLQAPGKEESFPDQSKQIPRFVRLIRPMSPEFPRSLGIREIRAICGWRCLLLMRLPRRHADRATPRNDGERRHNLIRSFVPVYVISWVKISAIRAFASLRETSLSVLY